LAADAVGTRCQQSRHVAECAVGDGIDGLVSGDYETFGAIGEIDYRTMDFQESEKVAAIFDLWKWKCLCGREDSI
jgi:hypothetical protein